MSEIMDLEFYHQTKEILLTARNRVYSTANFTMVEVYWNVGRSIMEQQGGGRRWADAHQGGQRCRAVF